MAGKKGMKWSRKIRNPRSAEELRAEIEAGKIVNVLKRYVFGETEMTPQQVTAAVALLRKVLPDKAEQTLDATVKYSVDPEAVLSKLAAGLPAGDSPSTTDEVVRH